MGLRFYKRVRLFPGARINLSKGGVSFSLGGRGAWWTVGTKGQRTTIGLPGSGLSWTEQQSWKRDQEPQPGAIRPQPLRHRPHHHGGPLGPPPSLEPGDLFWGWAFGQQFRACSNG